jgi:hypothetical protein
MSEDNKKISKEQILDELRREEEVENQLIWLYQTLIDLGIENCFSEDNKIIFRDNMKILKEESEKHKIMINSIIDKHNN